jgi:hypothetical protein
MKQDVPPLESTRRASPFNLGVGRAIPLVSANKAISLDSDAWTFAFTAVGGGPTGKPPLGAVTVPGTMEAQGYGPPNTNISGGSGAMRNSNGQTCSYSCLDPNNFSLPPHPLAGFSRTFEVPAEWRDLATASPPHSFVAVLRVERVHRIGEVFVDGQRLANLPNYLVPTEIELPAAVLEGGTHRLDIVVDSWYDPANNNFWSAADMLDPDGGAYAGSWTGVSGHVDLLLRQTTASLVSATLQITPRLNTTTQAWSVQVQVEATGNASAVDFSVFDSATPVPLQVASASARVVGGVAEASIELLDCKSRGCKPWTPDTPALYKMVASVEGGNQQVSRFGLRTLRVEGPNFLLNGAPLFLRGYGDDATDYIYSGLPTAPGPSVEISAYRKKLRRAKALGMNFFRPHSQVVTPEYAWAAAEEGMFLSLELPIGDYVKFSTDNDRKLILAGANATVKNYRNIPSVFVFAVGNELMGDYTGTVGEAVAALKPLHGWCKAMQNNSFCIDCDGQNQNGELGARTSTLGVHDDFVSSGFDGGACLDELRGRGGDTCVGRFNIGNYGRNRSFPVPVIAHEMGNFNSFPRYTSLIAATNNTVVVPTWAFPVRDFMRASGLESQEDTFAHNSEQLLFQITKNLVEYLRKADAVISGYELWVLQDYFGIFNGLITQDLRMKPGLNVTAINEFNAAIVITENALCCSSRLQSQPSGWLNTTLNINSFAPISNWSGSALDWQVLVGQNVACAGSRKVDFIEQGAITFGANVSCALPTLPQASPPQPVELRTQLVRCCGDGVAATNTWRDYLTLHPPFSTASAPFPVFSALDLSLCPYSNCKPLPADGQVPEGAVVLASNDMSTAAVAVAAKAGGSLVLVASDEMSVPWPCPAQFPYPDKKLASVCFNESAFATSGGGPCGSWCTVCAGVGTGCGRPICSTAANFSGCVANVSSIPSIRNAFGTGTWDYGSPDNAGTVVSAEASDAIFAGSVAPNAPLLVAYAKQVTGAAFLITNLTHIGGISVTNKSVLVRALDAAMPKTYGGAAHPHGVPHHCREKALLLRAELASGATVLATGLNVVQPIPAPAGQAVDPQSTWLLRRILAHAAALASRQRALKPTPPKTHDAQSLFQRSSPVEPEGRG